MSTDATTHNAADIVFINGRFTTMDPARPTAEAVAIKNGVFVKVGGEADV